MPTITRCRIASDVDHLSKVQLEDVSSELKKHHPKLHIECNSFDTTDVDQNEAPNSPLRVARLMRKLLDEEFDVVGEVSDGFRAFLSRGT